MKIKLFTKKGCMKCPTAKKLCEELSDQIKVEYYLVDEVEGLAEASYHEVIATPSIVIVDDQDREVKSFRGVIPTKEELAGVVNAN